jgi:uncharacterized protein YbaP (TraB family)
MFSGILFRWAVFAFAIVIGWIAPQIAEGAACVWKVTSANGHSLYLGGSFHFLRPTDYPLPPQYNRAFDACAQLAFEEDPKTGAAAAQALFKAGEYPKGDSLKNHVDPRTYEYLRRFFALRHVPEEKFARFRPWLLDILLSSPPPQYYQLGVEQFLLKRALANSKPISGLESTREQNQVFIGLSDHQAEALLLTLFINAGREDGRGVHMFDAWRRGDVELLTSKMRESFRDFPAMAERLLDARNRNWIPKIESYLRSGQVFFVVVGAAHMGGPDGVLALLRTKGYQIEQL